MDKPTFPDWVTEPGFSDLVHGVKVWSAIANPSHVVSDCGVVALVPKVEMSEVCGELEQEKITVHVRLDHGHKDVLTLSDDEALRVAGQLINHIATITEQNPYEVAKTAVNKGFDKAFAATFDKHQPR